MVAAWRSDSEETDAPGRSPGYGRAAQTAPAGSLWDCGRNMADGEVSTRDMLMIWAAAVHRRDLRLEDSR